MSFPLGSIAHHPSQLEVALHSTFKELGVPEQEWTDRGLDINNTPRRVAKMYKRELLTSYQPQAEEKLAQRFTCFGSDGSDALVTIGPIDFTSLCAHHLLPFVGRAYVGYLPGDLLIGASKIPRAVEHYSRMLQIQERMARQIAEFVQEQSQARVVIALLIAQHHCMVCRGVKQQNVRMVTTAISPMEMTSDRGIINEFYQNVELLARLTPGL